MKICLAQTKAIKGNIKSNIENHKKWIDIAIFNKADLIIFPELSLTGYEPELAWNLATDPNDFRLEEFQRISDRNAITIGAGIPIKSDSGIFISMAFFQPNLSRVIYSKQILHSDELPYFIQGNGQVILNIKNTNIAPAICYESLQPQHSVKAIHLGAELYIASVAKSQNGVEKAYKYFPGIAKKNAMPVLMCNSVGYCDNFESAGQTSAWDENGVLIGQLNNKNEGVLIFDTETKELIIKENNIV